MTSHAKKSYPKVPDDAAGLSEEDALVCMALLLKGLMRVHPDRESWALGETLTGGHLEATYRFPRMRFRYLLRRSLEHAEDVKTSLKAEGLGASFTEEPESMVTVLSADVSRAEFIPHVREALVCLVFHVEVLAESVFLSEDNWSLARAVAAKAAPEYGIPRDRFRVLLDGAMRTIARLRESNPFSAMY